MVFNKYSNFASLIEFDLSIYKNNGLIFIFFRTITQAKYNLTFTNNSTFTLT